MRVNEWLKDRPRPRGEDGFTLLELLVVLAILGLLIGLVAPAVLRQFGNAKVKIAAQAIAQTGNGLDLYKLDVGSYPSTEQGLQALITAPTGVANWNGPYLKSHDQPTDPWGHPYIYRNPASEENRDYDLCSLGADGQVGGTGENADICNR